MFRRRESFIVVASVSVLLLVVVLYFAIRRCFRPNRVAVAVTEPRLSRQTQPQTQPQTTATLQPQRDPKRRLYHPFVHRGSSTRKRFDWADHPTLITDVVENGWTRFAFTHFNASWSVRSSLFRSLRSTNGSSNDSNNKHEHQVEESWEVGLGSIEVMQKLHFKINNVTKCSYPTAKFTVRMDLPLPGPQLATSFPQEAYFEIMVVNCSGNKEIMKGDSRDWEKAKLLSQQSDSSVISGIKNSVGMVEGNSKDGGMNMSIGLSVGGSVMNRVPGSYPGSIGFHSNGSVYLSGMKLAFESEKDEWAQMGKVIGCGFDPRQKKVFFTLDSELAHVVHCKSEDFGMPLYPVLASNTDITVLVNLGQSSFRYSPANAQRTPNPCFTGPVQRPSPKAVLEYDDSKEFFSMGMLNSKWLDHSVTVNSITNKNSHNLNYYGSSTRTKDDDDESEAELFEIVLDST